MRLFPPTILFLLTMACCPFWLKAQPDSLQYWLTKKDDTSKVIWLQAYGQELLDKDNSTAKKIFENTISISKKLNYHKGIAVGYRKTGYVNGQTGEYRQAINDFLKSIEYYEKSEAHLKDLLVCYNNLGANYRQIGKVDSSMFYYLTSIEKLENWPIDKETSANRESMLSTLSLLYENVSSGYGNMLNVEKAMEYANKALTVSEAIRDSLQMANALISLSHAYYVNKDFKKSLEISTRAVNLATLIELPIPLSKAWHLKSVAYTGLGMPDSGMYAAKQSIEYARNTDRQLLITAYMDLADAYHDKKEYAQEAKALETVIKEFDDMDNVSFGMNVYEKLAQAKYAIGQYKEAYDYFGRSIEYKDSMMSRQNRETVAELEIQYQTAQKEKALADQQLQLQKNRQYISLSIAFIIVAVLIAGLMFLQYRNKRKLHHQQLTELNQQKEIQLLQALMQGEEKERSRIAKDLHDGVAGMLAAVKMHFNTLSQKNESIRQVDSYQQGLHLLDEAAIEIRKTSHNLMPEVLLHHGLDEALRIYCGSISNAGLKIQYDSWGSIGRYKGSFELSVYRIVQELMNNIIKHSNASEAMVQMSLQNGLLNITIEDNGVGFKKDSADVKGMGLHTLRSRVAAMNGKIEMDTKVGSGVSAYLEFDTAGLEKS